MMRKLALRVSILVTAVAFAGCGRDLPTESHAPDDVFTGLNLTAEQNAPIAPAVTPPTTSVVPSGAPDHPAYRRSRG